MLKKLTLATLLSAPLLVQAATTTPPPKTVPAAETVATSKTTPAATTETTKPATNTTAQKETKPMITEKKSPGELDFDKGAEYLKKDKITDNETKEAFKYFKKSADAGYGPAAYNVAMMYLNGNGTNLSDVEAIKYLRLGASYNEVKSQASLGVIYLLGEYGEAKNPTEAQKYFELVLKSKAPESTQLLTGIGLKYTKLPGDENKKEAFKYLKAAADRGETNAEYHLGLLYKEGNGTPKNIPLAVQNFLKAGNGGNPFALIKLSEMSQTGDGVPKNKIKALALMYVASSIVPQANSILQQLEIQYSTKEQTEAKKMAVQIIKERKIDKFLGVQIKK